MRVAVVGAGAAGLGAARTLHAAGAETVVFETAGVVGGRISTERIGGFVFDTGATAITPRGRALEKAMLEEISTEGLCHIEAPIYVHSSLRAMPGDPAKNRVPRYCYEVGNDALPERLAEGLDVRLRTEAASLEPSNGGYLVDGEGFDAAVLTVPVPELHPLLASAGESRPISNCVFRPCLSLMLGYDMPPPAVPYHALLDPENSHPLTWLSIESAKCPSRAPEGQAAFVCQMGPQFSRLYFESDEASIVDAGADILVRLFGKAWDVPPKVSAVKRWRYSQPEMTALFDHVNRQGAKLMIAGDGVMGARVEYAYDSGVKAARMLLGEE